MEDRDLLRRLSFMRLAIGIALLAAPRLAVKVWTGESNNSSAVVLAARGLGAREVALAAGTLAAMENGGPARRWVEAAVIADTADALSVFGRLPGMARIQRLGQLVGAGGAALLGIKIASSIDD